MTSASACVLRRFVYAVTIGMVATLPFLCLFQFGFLYMAIVSLVQQHSTDGLVLRAQVAGE